MLRVVDRCNGHVIEKVITPHGKVLGYQTHPEGVADASKVKRCPTLAGARESTRIGLSRERATVEVANPTKPKASYLQNIRGYKASGGKGKGR